MENLLQVTDLTENIFDEGMRIVLLEHLSNRVILMRAIIKNSIRSDHLARCLPSQV